MLRNREEYALKLQALVTGTGDLAQALAYATLQDLDPVVVLLLGLHRVEDPDRLTRARAETRAVRQLAVIG